MDPQVLGGPREIAPMALEHTGNESLLEFPTCVDEQDPFIDHFGDE
jgi:hypothetical protein